MKGVLDRFEGTNAVILVEENQEEFIVPRTELPEASIEGIWYHLSKVNGHYKVHSVDVEATEKASSANALLLENLRKRNKQSKFKRNDS